MFFAMKGQKRLARRFKTRDEAVLFILGHADRDDLTIKREDGRVISLNPYCCRGYRCTRFGLDVAVRDCHTHRPNDWNGLCPYQI